MLGALGDEDPPGDVVTLVPSRADIIVAIPNTMLNDAFGICIRLNGLGAKIAILPVIKPLITLALPITNGFVTKFFTALKTLIMLLAWLVSSEEKKSSKLV